MQDDLRTLLAERTRYDAAVVEPAVLERWIDAHAFEANADDPGEPYVIALPPPNVTGALHMGHALSGTIQDVLIRVHRMRGRNALWIYGTDHAGIATQMVVERLLASEGSSRHELGREGFVDRVWQWRRETGTTITGQYLRLGASLDFRRESFTMDPEYARAVTKVFVDLYRKGYLFRANRMINWSPGLLTAISDLEVEYRDVEDVMYEIDYPLVGGGHVTVATVRPVTLLGDTAIAVNPGDERFRDLIGRTAIVPLAEREVPIIGDDYVDISVGTGALKVTPAHDPNDFEIGQRHGLAEIQVIGFDGRMTEAAGERYADLTVAEASERVLADLRARDLVRSETPYLHSVGHCQRSGARVEPLVSLQWFCRMDELAAPATAAVRDGTVRFHPKSAERIFFGWMDSIRPWCVSRQLWWGHQLPVWYCENDHVIVQETAPERCPECGIHQIERDPDVLDTWFSSALWPFATLGWPEDTRDLETFYPGHVLCTAREIINLWVARMMMMGKEFLGEQPFFDVVIHSVVQAADGRRMSKSLGTGIDPIELIERYGADAVRYGLLKMSSTQDVRFAEGMIDEGRGLTNKLWNAGRLILMSADDVAAGPDRGCVGRRLGADAARSRDRRDLEPDRRVRLRGGREGALPLRLERRLRLVPRGREGAPVLGRSGRARPGVGNAPLRARSHAAPLPSRPAARHRGALALRRRRGTAGCAPRSPWPARSSAMPPRRLPSRPRSRLSAACGDCATTRVSARGRRSRSSSRAARTPSGCAARPTCSAASAGSP